MASQALQGNKTTSDEEWTKILSPEQFRILRGKGTVSEGGAGRWGSHWREWRDDGDPVTSITD